jgi:hypothetical protein
MREAGERAIAQLKQPFNGDAYALAALLYKDTTQPLSVRMAAMHAAMPYERPRLSQIDMTHRSLNQLTDEDFFRAWDSVARYLAERGRPKLLEAMAAADVPTVDTSYSRVTSAETEGK